VNITRRSLLTLAAVALPLAVLAACGDDDGGSSDGLEITGAWARTSAAGATNGAAYMVIRSGTDDRLLTASAPATVAARAEIHETVVADGGMSGDSMTDSTMSDDSGHGSMGEMTMRPVDGIDIEAGTPLELKAGSYHVMLFDLASPLEAGSTFDLTLTFEKAGTRVVTVEVRDDAP
jgi:hypothetical protein